MVKVTVLAKVQTDNNKHLDMCIFL